jgi:calcium/calmodulin-dependent protein kinase I
MGAKNSSFHKSYEIKETLGKGSFATVKRCIKKSDKSEFAVKEIKKKNLSEEELVVVRDEVNIMGEIDHPNCVKLYEMFDSPKKVYMVIELLTGGEMFDRIVQKGNFTEAEAAKVMKVIVSALKYLHGIGITHRDLKPENLLYCSPKADANIKITDFGLAKLKNSPEDGEQKMVTACGTPGYVAPEVLKNEPYGPAVDLWSMGVILYILLCGFPPFYHESTTMLYKQIKKGSYSFPDPYWSEISDNAKDLVGRLLTVDPAKRATPDDVLAHEWMHNASDSDLGAGFTERLKLMQAKARLRKAVGHIVAVNRFKRAVQSLEKNLQ